MRCQINIDNSIWRRQVRVVRQLTKITVRRWACVEFAFTALFRRTFVIVAVPKCHCSLCEIRAGIGLKSETIGCGFQRDANGEVRLTSRIVVLVEERTRINRVSTGATTEAGLIEGPGHDEIRRCLSLSHVGRIEAHGVEV